MTKPEALRGLINSGKLVLPGAFNAASALLAEKNGFDAVYISGAALSNGVAGLPDTGLLTLTEMAQLAGYIARSVNVPAIADADTGFGGPENASRTVTIYEQAGIAGIHIEDQAWPKRCGHLSGKSLVSLDEMKEKIRAAGEAREDPDFIFIARTDARGVTGFDDAVRRAHSYIEAGADMIFPEALENAEEFREFARQVKAPLMANMTEFGKTPCITAGEFHDMGYQAVIFPMTTFRSAMKAVEESLQRLKSEGTQRGFLDRMQTRSELYELLKYKP